MSACAITRGPFASPAPSLCSNPPIETSPGFREPSEHGVGSVLAAAHTVWNSDPAIGGAGEHKARQAPDLAFDLTDSIQMSHLVLRHRIGPALDCNDSRHRRHPEQRAELVAYRPDDISVWQRHHLALQHSAHESPREN